MTTSLHNKRILFVLPTLDLGGAERQALLLADYLRNKHGSDVAISALFGGTGGQAVRALCRDLRLPCLRFTMPEYTTANPEKLTNLSIRQFIRELRFLAPDLLLPYTSLPNVLCGVSWRKAGEAATLWGQRDAGIESPLPIWQPLALAQTNHFVTNSNSGYQHLLNSLHIPAEKITLIPNGTHLAPPLQSRDASRAQLGISPDTLLAGMVANIQPLKDHRTLLLAWQQVVKSLPRNPPILCLAGQITSSCAPLQKFAADLGLDPFIRWLGPVADISGFLAALDLAVFSSVKEGLPNGILEPMAAGLPVIATDNAGTRQALGDAQTPHFAHPDNPHDLAAKILTTLNDPSLRRAAAQTNRQRVATHFSLHAMGAAYYQLLTRILN